MDLPPLAFPAGLDAAGFVSRYWQRRPLLLRGALPGYRSPISPEELAGLACERGVEARLVLEKHGVRPWEVRHGPFVEGDFARLPESHWTLLVQDVDKHVPEVARLLAPFRFVPDWRIDDIMVSYAPDQGSVGPHVDDYAVFLVQALGQRRWRIDDRKVAETDFVPGLDLRILPEFEARQDWVLEPGDVLYLPPKVAHWGIALGDCMTYSVGFRAPLLSEFAHSWAHALIEHRFPEGRWNDPAPSPQAGGAEIGPEVFARVASMLAPLASPDPDLLRRWLGCFLTETKENLHPEPRMEVIETGDFALAWKRHALLVRSGYARMAFCEGSDGTDLLFVNGLAYELSSENGGFLHVLTEKRRLFHADLVEWLRDPECLELLCRLYHEGFFEFADG